MPLYKGQDTQMKNEGGCEGGLHELDLCFILLASLSYTISCFGYSNTNPTKGVVGSAISSNHYT